MSAPDEFRFLAGDAQQVGRTKPLPRVRRVRVPVTQGRQLAALQYVPEQPPKFVFVHGMGLNAHGFDPTVLALDTPALALDLPGHGQSDWRADADYRPQLLAADVLLAVTALAPAPVTLVGHSLGGPTAALVATALGERLAGLILLDITPGLRPQQDGASISEFITGQRDFGSTAEMVDRAIAFGIGTDRAALTRGVALNARQREDGRWEWAHHFAHLPGQATATFGEGTPFAPLWAPLTAIHERGTPVSLVRGSAGLVDAQQLAQWQQHLPGSAVLTVPGPHNLHETSPAQLARTLSRLAYS